MDFAKWFVILGLAVFIIGLLHIFVTDNQFAKFYRKVTAGRFGNILFLFLFGNPDSSLTYAYTIKNKKSRTRFGYLVLILAMMCFLPAIFSIV